MSAIQEDAQTVDTTSEAMSVDEASEALLSKFMKDSPEEAEESVKEEKKVKTKDAEDESEDESETSGDENESPEEDEDSEEGKNETEEDDRNIIEDDSDTFVKIKIDGDDRTVSVKDLKRLYGQEASLTRKSQEVSKKRKEAEELGAKYVAGVTGLLTKAQEKSSPYKQIDWLAAAQQLEPTELNALRGEAQQAFEQEKYLSEELNTFMSNLHAQRNAQLVEKGREAVKELKRDIPGWNEKVYNDVRHFAISSGLEVDIVDNLVDAAAIKLIHKAMLYDKGKSGVVTKKKNNTPKKVIKTSKKSGATIKDVATKADAAKAMKKLQSTGSRDDAAEAFLSRWSTQSDD
jgi:hypothetical protein